MLQVFGFWVGLTCTIICAIYALLSYHFPRQTTASAQGTGPSGPKIWLVWILTLASLAFVSFDYYDRHYQTPVFSCRDLIPDYGFTAIPNQTSDIAHATIDSSLLTQYQNDYKIFVVIRVSYSNVDEMTDTYIDKSAEFTITGNPVIIGIPIQENSSNLNFSTTQENLLFFYLAILPNDISPNQVFSLSNITTLGGKILDRVGLNLPPAPNLTNPPAAPHQVPAPQ